MKSATVKAFCRMNGIDEASADLADIIYNALVGDYCGSIDGYCAPGEKIETAIPHGAARTADSRMRLHAGGKTDT